MHCHLKESQVSKRLLEDCDILIIIKSENLHILCKKNLFHAKHASLKLLKHILNHMSFIPVALNESIKTH